MVLPSAKYVVADGASRVSRMAIRAFLSHNGRPERNVLNTGHKRRLSGFCLAFDGGAVPLVVDGLIGQLLPARAGLRNIRIRLVDSTGGGGFEYSTGEC